MLDNISMTISLQQITMIKVYIIKSFIVTITIKWKFLIAIVLIDFKAEIKKNLSTCCI